MSNFETVSENHFDFQSEAVNPTGHEHLLDDPKEWVGFSKKKATASEAEETWESYVVLEGMHCAACALNIEEALTKVDGVMGAQVSAATQRAQVVWEAGKVRPSEWMEAVRQAGYRALPAMDAFAREQRTRENREALWRWLVAGFCMMQVMMYAWPSYQAMPGDLSMEMEQLLRWASWVISLPVVLFACGPFFGSALRDLRLRRISMDLPVALGMLITFVISMMGTFDPAGPFGREVYYDSLTMFVFFLLTGRWLELRLRDRTAGALEAVMNRLPDSVERQAADGSFERVTVRRLQLHDVVRVLPGQAFPADGVIVQGRTEADEALLTGESTPVSKQPGDLVTAGSYNLQAPILVRVQGLGEATRFAEIVALMESATAQKPRLAQLADKFARPFLIGVVLASAFAGVWWWSIDPARAPMIAVSVLIVTCPCALSLATPVAMLTAAGTLARKSVLVRNLQGLEALAEVDTVIFDKTGTLTADVQELRAAQIADESRLMQAIVFDLVAELAAHSLHPVSRALVAALPKRLQTQPPQVSQVQEVVGGGLTGRWLFGAAQPFGVAEWPSEGLKVRLGSALHAGVDLVNELSGRWVFLTIHQAGQWREVARFALGEQLRPEVTQVVTALHEAGLVVELLSGDKDQVVQQIANQAGITVAHGDCSPEDKLARLQALQTQGRRVAMVGDGMNDGPVLAGAHVSIAFGRAVPLAQSRSDFVVLGENLVLIQAALLLSRNALRVVRQNLWWAAIYNAASVPLAIAGYMPAWLAGLGMALSSLLVVGNAARLARFPEAVLDLDLERETLVFSYETPPKAVVA